MFCHYSATVPLGHYAVLQSAIIVPVVADWTSCTSKNYTLHQKKNKKNQ